LSAAPPAAEESRTAAIAARARPLAPSWARLLLGGAGTLLLGKIVASASARANPPDGALFAFGAAVLACCTFAAGLDRMRFPVREAIESAVAIAVALVAWMALGEGSPALGVGLLLLALAWIGGRRAHRDGANVLVGAVACPLFWLAFGVPVAFYALSLDRATGVVEDQALLFLIGTWITATLVASRRVAHEVHW
jgi:hypothetical protein